MKYFQISRAENSHRPGGRKERSRYPNGARDLITCRSGSTMVESAIFFPIVILSVMAMLYLLINQYSKVCTAAHIHTYLRQEASSGNNTIQVEIADRFDKDRYRALAEAASVEVHSGRKFGAEYIEGERMLRYFGGRLASKSGYSFTHYGRSYILDEAGIARGLYIAKSVG